MTQHSAGPWEVDADTIGAGVSVKAGSWFVASCFDLAGKGDTLSNARLISAAPDLLAALQMAKHIVANEGNYEQMAQVFAAIAKATGEPA